MIEVTQHESIAVVGMAGRFPGARNIYKFWKNLIEGHGSISSLGDDELREARVSEQELHDPNYVKTASTIEGIEWLDAALFGISPREAEILDPQHRVFLETCHVALQHAGYDPGAFEGRIGLYAGARNNEYLERNLRRNSDVMHAVGEMAALISNHTDYLSTGVAYRLNLRGPAITTVTACSTSLVAIHLACCALRIGECELALAGGVEIALPTARGYIFSEGGILSPDGQVRPFDANARGTVFGSGSGAVVLRRLSDALAANDTIHAVILGSAINNDGSRKAAFAAPSRAGQAAAIEAALSDSGVEPTTIGFVEAHGTGTIVGDPVEVAALNDTYGRDTDRAGYCALASVKGNVGHLGAAAGICGLIKAVCCVREGKLPASLNYAEPNPRIDFDNSPFYVNRTLAEWPGGDSPRRAGISSFGVGGTNAHVIIEEPPARLLSLAPRRPYQLLTLSARTQAALEAASSRLGRHLASSTDELADMAYTLNVGRADLPARRILVARHASEAAARLTGDDPPLTATILAKDTDRAVAFLFPGQGAQYAGMARGLYSQERRFAAQIDWCAEVLWESHRLDLTGLLFPESVGEAAAARLSQTAATQPALFAVEYALARLLQEWGVEPSVMIGHSVGEYVAACLAGVLGIEDALRLVAERGALMQALAGGSMLAVMLPEEMLRPMLPAEVDLAAVNAPGVCVVSGADDDIRQLGEMLTLQGIASRPLQTSHAFHSRMMDPVLEGFRARVSAVKLGSPRMRYMSNVTGTWITADEATDPDYWVRQLRCCVRFSDAVRSLVAEGRYVFAEVGPGQSLTGLVGAHVNSVAKARSAPVAIPVMRRAQEERDDVAVLLEAVGRIWAAGAPVGWEQFWSDERRRRVPLPSYPYERTRFWVEPAVEDPPVGEHASAAESGPFYVPTWRETALPALPEAQPAAGKTLWVAFCRTGDPAAGAVDLLRQAGAEVMVVEPGDEFAAGPDAHYTVRVREKADYARVLEDVAAAGPARIRLIHAWAAGDSEEDHSGRAYTWHVLDHGFFSVLTVLQEAARLLFGIPIDLCIITSDMQNVTGEGNVEPTKAAVLGLVKVAPKEFDAITCRSIDVGLRAPAELLASQLFGELTSGAGDVQVAYRGRKRWTWSYAGIQLSAPDGAPAVLKEHGVYLITGGLGGLGLALAEQLAQLVGARLVLVGRTGLPDRAEWPALLADADDSDPLARRLRAIQGVEKAGGEVLVLAGDVTDEERMREVRAKAEQAFGSVDGIFHLAAVAGGALLETRSRDAAEQVLGPKVEGTRVLDSVFCPDLFVLYSSITVVIGDYGLGDYAAANAVMDTFAQSCWASGRKVVSINWPAWAEAGMAHETHGPAVLDDLALGLLAPAPVVHPLLRSRRDQADGKDDFVAFEVEMTPTQWALAEHRLEQVPTMPATAIVELARAGYQEVTGSQTAELRDLTFLRPLTAEPGAEVRAELRRRPDGGFDLSITGRASGQPKKEYARGRIYPAPPVETPRHDLSSVRHACPRDTTPGKVGTPVLQLGPRWDNITTRLSGPDLELVTIELPEEFKADLGEFLLHPAILDTACGLGMNVVGQGVHLPFSYERIVVRGPLPSRCHSIIRHLDDTRGDIVRANATIVDDHGDELVAIQGYTLLRLASGVTATAAAATTSEPIAGGQSGASRPGSAGRADTWQGEADLGISLAQGAEALRAVLAGGIGPQVLFCPGGIPERQRRSARVTRAALVERLVTPTAEATATRSLATPYVAPASGEERALAQLWQETIGVDSVGIDDDFLDIGGNSLMAVQLASRISEHFGFSVSVAEMFDSRTVRLLAAAVGERVTSIAQDDPGQPPQVVETPG